MGAQCTGGVRNAPGGCAMHRGGAQVENQIFLLFFLFFTGHSNAQANFQGLVGTDPGGSERYESDFQHLQDCTFLACELGFAIRARLPRR